MKLRRILRYAIAEKEDRDTRERIDGFCSLSLDKKSLKTKDSRKKKKKADTVELV